MLPVIHPRLRNDHTELQDVKQYSHLHHAVKPTQWYTMISNRNETINKMHKVLNTKITSIVHQYNDVSMIRNNCWFLDYIHEASNFQKALLHLPTLLSAWLFQINRYIRLKHKYVTHHFQSCTSSDTLAPAARSLHARAKSPFLAAICKLPPSRHCDKRSVVSLMSVLPRLSKRSCTSTSNLR